MSRRGSRVGIIAIGLVCLAAGCGDDSSNGESPAEGSSEPIRVGFIGDLTGPNAAGEAPILAGLKARVDQVNEAGGIEGRKIEVLAEDHRFEVNLALSAYRRIKGKDVMALSGIGSSAMIQAVGPQVQKDKIPVVGATATDSHSLSNPYFFNTQLDLETQAKAMAEHMLAQKSGAKVGVVSVNAPSGQEWAGLIEKYVGEGGGSVAEPQWIEPGSVEARSQISALKRAGVDVVTVHMGISAGVVILKEMAAQGLEIPFFSNYGSTAEQQWLGAGAFPADQIKGMTGFLPPYSEVDGQAELMKAVEAGGLDEETWRTLPFVWGWTAGNVLVEALERAGGDVDSQELVEVLNESDPPFTSGGYTSELSWADGRRLGNAQAWIVGWDAASKQLVPEGEPIAVEGT